MRKRDSIGRFAPRDASERFWEKVLIGHPEECWLWSANTNRGGYGMFYLDGDQIQAHRFAYEDAVGPIPDDLELDHVRDRGCEHRHCVNPAHLEPVTHAENMRRAALTWTSKETCDRGHAYAEVGVKVYNGRRHCLACSRENARTWDENNRETRARWARERYWRQKTSAAVSWGAAAGATAAGSATPEEDT